MQGILSLYAIFHTPRERHGEVLRTLATFLPARGALLVTMGASDWEGWESDFHGTTMYWSHYGPERNRRLVEDAGFAVMRDEVEQSYDERHQVMLAVRR